MCRIMVSMEKCLPPREAKLSQELYLMGLIGLQIMENIDIGGLYGNLFDLLDFLSNLDQFEEIPSYLLSNVEFEEFPLLPGEKVFHLWIGNLYREPVKGEITFRELWQKLKEDFKSRASLSFLYEVFSG